MLPLMGYGFADFAFLIIGWLLIIGGFFFALGWAAAKLFNRPRHR